MKDLIYKSAVQYVMFYSPHFICCHLIQLSFDMTVSHTTQQHNRGDFAGLAAAAAAHKGGMPGLSEEEPKRG
jgi:hypothetical protein